MRKILIVLVVAIVVTVYFVWPSHKTASSAAHAYGVSNTVAELKTTSPKDLLKHIKRTPAGEAEQATELATAQERARAGLECFYQAQCTAGEKKSSFLKQPVQINFDYLASNSSDFNRVNAGKGGAKGGPNAILPAKTRLSVLADMACLNEQAARTGLLLGAPLSANQPLDLRFQRVPIELPGDLSVSALQNAVSGEKCIVGVSLDQTMHIVGSSFVAPTTVLSQQVNLAGEEAIAGWQLMYSSSTGASKATTVAIIDTGADTTHPNLIPSFLSDSTGVVAADCSISSTCSRVTALVDHQGHGTHCAGLVGATATASNELYGIAPGVVRIMPVKAWDSDGGSITPVTNGIYWAVTQGADVLSMSLGSSSDDFGLDDAIQGALAGGVMIAVAAGNDGKNLYLDKTYPAFLANDPTTYGGLITVGSFVAETDAISSFSNYANDTVAIAAAGSSSNTSVGSGILSTYSSQANPGGMFAYLAGTSMATPQVAGALALTKSWLTSNSVSLSTGQAGALQITNLVTTYSVGDSGLTNYFINGTRLDLKTLANGLVNKYPQLSGTIFTLQPVSVTVNQGQSATFTAQGSGPAPLTYQWQFNGKNISGQTGTSLVLSAVLAAQAGRYTVVLTSAAGSITSNPAQLTVNYAPASLSVITFTAEPIGQAETLTIKLSGVPTPSVQWYKNGVAISGATSASYTISSTQMSDLAQYTVKETNGLGSATSAAATLKIDLFGLDNSASTTLNLNDAAAISFKGGFR